MDTIIDGYNLIFQCGLQSSTADERMLRDARARLVREIVTSVPKSVAKKITIVYDAAERPLLANDNCDTVGGVKIFFSDEYDEADSMIEHLIAQHSVPQKLTVVSCDHRLHKAALRRRAIPIDSDVWYEKMIAGHLKEPKKSHAARSRKNNPAAVTEIPSELDEIDWHDELQIRAVDVNAIAQSVDEESEPSPDVENQRSDSAPVSSPDQPEKPVKNRWKITSIRFPKATLTICLPIGLKSKVLVVKLHVTELARVSLPKLKSSLS